MFAFLVALAALAGSTRADCDACIAGRCHSRNTIISGLPITDQMAVDLLDNTLYLQLNGNQNVAISLDHHEISLINMMKTTGMVVEQESSKLYLGTKEIPNTFYTYDRASNTTATNLVLNRDIKYYSGNYLPLAMDVGEWHYTYLNDLPISGLVVDNFYKQVYFVSNNTLYVHNNEDEPVREILRRDHMVLSADKWSYIYKTFSDDRTIEVYIGDATEKVIYKLDKSTEKLNVYAAYKTGAVAEFIFGKYNQLLTRDVDGSVVQWVPTLPTLRDEDEAYNSKTTRCVVDPPSPNYSIRQLDPTNCNINY